MIVTIDGPSGTGKSSVAKELAKRLGYTYLDTGAMYRAVTLACLRAEIDVDDSERLQPLLDNFHLHVEGERFYIADEDVTEVLRSAPVTAAVSRISAIRAVRERLVGVQRELAKEGSIVVEGRDVGTVVFPQANHKFFLTASPEERAERRYREVFQKDPQRASKVTVEQILEEQQQRDTYDSTRPISPLRPAVDAVEVDTSALTLEQVVDFLARHVRGGSDAVS